MACTKAGLNLYPYARFVPRWTSSIAYLKVTRLWRRTGRLIQVAANPPDSSGDPVIFHIVIGSSLVDFCPRD